MIGMFSLIFPTRRARSARSATASGYSSDKVCFRIYALGNTSLNQESLPSISNRRPCTSWVDRRDWLERYTDARKHPGQGGLVRLRARDAIGSSPSTPDAFTFSVEHSAAAARCTLLSCAVDVLCILVALYRSRILSS